MFRNKQAKRIFRLLCLLLALCLIPLGACSEEKPEEKPSASADISPLNSEAEPETEPAVETEEKLPFEVNDYGGRDFNFFVAKGFLKDIYAEEQTGSVANDVIFDRNARVESLYNVKIGIQEGEANSMNDFPKLTAMVAAGESGIDVVDHCVYKAHNFILGDIVANWYDIPGTDMTNPGWLIESNDASTFNGKLFGASGALNLSSLLRDWVMFYNPVMLDDLGIGTTNFQEMIINGEWTLDKMKSLVENLYVDLNGNGERDYGDQYGYIADWPTLDPMFTVAGRSMTGRDDEGNLVITFMSEETVALYRQLLSEHTLRQIHSFPSVLDKHARFLKIHRTSPFSIGFLQNPSIL